MHALNSDETHEGIEKHCEFEKINFTNECNKYLNRASDEVGNIDLYNIYAPRCDSAATKTDASTPIYSVSSILPRCFAFLHLCYVILPLDKRKMHFLCLSNNLCI